MVSHKESGGTSLSVSVDGGLRFKKKPGRHAICVGKKLKGEPGPTHGGRYDKEFQARFIAASKACSL